jgi:hypothetical protein
MLSESLEPNKTNLLRNLVYDEDLQWVTKSTAILVVHGIGNQMPIETIDQFGRGLMKVLKREFDDDITLEHLVVPKDNGDNGYWMDNVLRIAKKGSDCYIDIYEYYWAHYTEDQASWSELNSWLEGVVKGAKAFYQKNATIGYFYKDHSIFFDSKTGAFNVMNYRIFISAISKTFLTIDAIARFFLWVLAMIPLLGSIAGTLVKKYSQSYIRKFTNVLGDVVVYNAVDPKSKFYNVRKKIQDGAVKSLTFIIERTKEDKEKNDPSGKATEPSDKSLYYESVIVAGHSLGSQVSYDAINLLNLMINQGKIAHYNEAGKCTLKNRTGKSIADQLRGFITFGSPLDKIVFFLRENVPDNEYIRQQILSQYHGFKIRNLNFMNNHNSNKAYVPIAGSLKRYLDGIKWRNYFDNTDYVSGGLDYFDDVVNIDCQFKAGKFGFTHSDYWTCDAFYKDLVINFLNNK